MKESELGMGKHRSRPLLLSMFLYLHPIKGTKVACYFQDLSDYQNKEIKMNSFCYSLSQGF